MSAPSIHIQFQGHPALNLSLKPEGPTVTHIPTWANLTDISCPGNQLHGPRVKYCRLMVELSELVEHFDAVTSIEQGTLELEYEDNTKVSMSNNAQTLFFNAFWFVILHSKCSVFKFSQWARSHYLPTQSPERLLYAFLSIVVIEKKLANDNNTDSIKETLVRLMRLLRDVLHNLIVRLQTHRSMRSDSVIGGLLMLLNLVTLFDLEYDQYFNRLKQNLEQNSLKKSTYNNLRLAELKETAHVL